MNYFITYIPCWEIRKRLLKLCGLNIGHGSRILMGCKIEGPKGIKIGSNTHINSYCHLDGRGGLFIGDNVNISNYSVITTGTHSIKSSEFVYRTGEVIIEDCCWLCTRCVVLDNSHLHKGAVIGAGSVFKGVAEEQGVYIGVPAIKAKERRLSNYYIDVWKTYFV